MQAPAACYTLKGCSLSLGSSSVWAQGGANEGTLAKLGTVPASPEFGPIVSRVSRGRHNPPGRHVSETGDLSRAALSQARPEPVLTGQQRALVAALRETDRQVAVMYLGALHVLQQSANPDRLALAAHAVRELMEKLPEHLDVPSHDKQPKGQASLNVKVRELAEHWSPIADVAAEATEVSPKMRKFNRKAQDFFVWFESNFHTRREQTVAAIRALDASRRPLPTPIEELHVQHWRTCNDFFQAVSHHKKTCSDDEFVSWLLALEIFLLDHMRPRTFDNFSSLDEIIAEGESDA
jgi:hypothetical protein